MLITSTGGNRWYAKSITSAVYIDIRADRNEIIRRILRDCKLFRYMWKEQHVSDIILCCLLHVENVYCDGTLENMCGHAKYVRWERVCMH